MDLTNEERFELVELFIGGRSARDSCDEFHRRHPFKKKPHHTTCLRVLQRLRKTGSVTPQTPPGRAKTVLTEENRTLVQR